MVDALFSDARLAALYDRLYPRSISKDFDFYLPLIMGTQSVLDVGCGTGTLLREAREAGHAGRLCGLDPAAAMLAHARRRADIEWVCGDLTSAKWAGEFDLVVMTGHTFQIFVEDREVCTALEAIRRALRRDGRLAFETRNPGARAWEKWAADRTREVVDPDGSLVRMTRHVDVPFDGRIVSFTETFTSPSWDAPLVSRSTLRFLDAASLSGLLADAGLEIEEQFGCFERRPLTATSPEIVTIARPGARGTR
jgi:SAM-dependent methyltransferase